MHTQQIPCDLNSFCESFHKQNNQKSIRRYLRDRKGKLTGVLLAYRDGDEIRFGWSKCKLKEDTFRKDFGLYIAAHRAAKRKYNVSKLLYEVLKSDVPMSVKKCMPSFMESIKRYFKMS